MSWFSSEHSAHWPSRWIFILAAIGSAAGLGNLWRFPFQAYKHGGASFVIALIIANIIIGIPLLALEVGLGQKMQKGAADAFAGIKKGLRYIGWLSVVLAFIVVSYYMAVVAWGVNYFGASFTTAWGTETKSYFFDSVLQTTDSVNTLGGFSWPVLAGLIIAWIITYFIVWKGVRSISKVVVWTATLPFVILVVLLARAVTLPGAGTGLELYLVPEWAKLADTQLWLAAFSQTFFSFSLAFGVMVAYGAYNREDTEVTKSVLWIAGGNLLVSILSGFVIFGTLGYMAQQTGKAITDVVAGGPSLAFVVFPKAISLLPAFNALIAVLFFGTLLLLALDSAFSILESVARVFQDRFPDTSTKKVTFAISVLGLLGSLVFATGAGLYVLDIVDHFVLNYGLVAVALLESIAVGWLWKGSELRDFINKHSDWKLGITWDIAIKVIAPVFLIILLGVNIYTEFQSAYGGYPVWALLWLGVAPLILVPIVAYLLDWLTGGNRS